MKENVTCLQHWECSIPRWRLTVNPSGNLKWEVILYHSTESRYESLSWCCHFWNKNCFSSVLGVLYRLWSSHWLQNPTTKRQVSCIDNGISSTVSMYFPNAPVSSFCYLFFLMPPQCFYLFLVVLLKKQKLCSKCHNTIYFFPGFYCIESFLCLGRSALLCPFRLQW